VTYPTPGNQCWPDGAQVTPSWYGDSVGHYEGDTLVIHAIDIKVGPLSTVNRYGTPHTQALHVVERYSVARFGRRENSGRAGTKENQFIGIETGGQTSATRASGRYLCQPIAKNSTRGSPPRRAFPFGEEMELDSSNAIPTLGALSARG
jgi:hypothetical protein